MNKIVREEKNCDLCGAAFIPYNSRQIYCSRSCYKKSMMNADDSTVGKGTACEYCGKLFTKRHPKQKYCNKICHKRMLYSLHHKSPFNRMRDCDSAQRAGLHTRKFDPKRCLRCIYSGGAEHAGEAADYCNYHALAENGTRTCLRSDDHGNVYDIRGDEYDNCAMYKSRGRTRRRERDGKD